jgi:hypothetical protein
MRELQRKETEFFYEMRQGRICATMSIFRIADA